MASQEIPDNQDDNSEVLSATKHITHGMAWHDMIPHGMI